MWNCAWMYSYSTHFYVVNVELAIVVTEWSHFLASYSNGDRGTTCLRPQATVNPCMDNNENFDFKPECFILMNKGKTLLPKWNLIAGKRSC